MKLIYRDRRPVSHKIKSSTSRRGRCAFAAQRFKKTKIMGIAVREHRERQNN